MNEGYPGLRIYELERDPTGATWLFDVRSHEITGGKGVRACRSEAWSVLMMWDRFHEFRCGNVECGWRAHEFVSIAPKNLQKVRRWTEPTEVHRLRGVLDGILPEVRARDLPDEMFFGPGTEIHVSYLMRRVRSPTPTLTLLDSSVDEYALPPPRDKPRRPEDSKIVQWVM